MNDNTIGIEVDALALMLDGAVFDLKTGYKFTSFNYQALVKWSGMEIATSMEVKLNDPEWREVAEAILELEGLADWVPDEDECLMRGGFPLSTLAFASLNLVEHDTISLDESLLEAAARLREGWRP